MSIPISRNLSLIFVISFKIWFLFICANEISFGLCIVSHTHSYSLSLTHTHSQTQKYKTQNVNKWKVIQNALNCQADVGCRNGWIVKYQSSIKLSGF